jgi:hypothetical protein
MLYTAKSAQFNSALSLKMRSLTRLFAENAQYNLKTHKWEDSGKFHFADQLCYALSAKTGCDKKFQISGQIWKKIFENVGCTVFCIYQWMKDAKQV